MKNMMFRRVLYTLSVLMMIGVIIVIFTLPWLVDWYKANIAIMKVKENILWFLYITVVPFVIVIFAIYKLSYSLLKDNCFNNENLKQLNLISIFSLIEFLIYLVATIFIYKNLVCFVITLVTLMTFTTSFIIKELVSNGIELKKENDLTI